MTLRHIFWRLREEFWPEKHPYDILMGCDTSGMVLGRRLGPEATDYQPVDPDVFRATMAHVIGHVTGHVIAHVNAGMCGDVSEFAFVDLGCGKGRALLLAEEYGFRQIVGVEFSAKLARIASRNAAKAGSARIAVVRSDVRAFDFPEGPLVVFLYNPFSVQITRSVIQRLASRPHTSYIAYVNPLHADAISSLPGAAVVAKDDWCTIWRFRGHTQASCTSLDKTPSASALLK